MVRKLWIILSSTVFFGLLPFCCLLPFCYCEIGIVDWHGLPIPALLLLTVLAVGMLTVLAVAMLLRPPDP